MTIDRTFSSVYSMKENQVYRRDHQPASDATEVVAFCETCGEETRFRMERVPAPYETEGVEEPLDVRGIIEGRVAWRCIVCMTPRTDPMAEEGYEWEETNQGHQVKAFPDEEVTWRAPGDDARTI